MVNVNSKYSPPDSLVEAGDGLGGFRVPEPSRSAEADLDRTLPELPTTFNLLHRAEGITAATRISKYHRHLQEHTRSHTTPHHTLLSHAVLSSPQLEISLLLSANFLINVRSRVKPGHPGPYAEEIHNIIGITYLLQVQVHC